MSDALPLLIALLVGLVAWALMRRDTKKPSPPAPVAPPPTPVDGHAALTGVEARGEVSQ